MNEKRKNVRFEINYFLVLIFYRRYNSVYAVMVFGILVATKNVQGERHRRAIVMVSATKQQEHVTANLDGVET